MSLNDTHLFQSEADQTGLAEFQRCLELELEPHPRGWCPRDWDGVLCWPPAPPHSLAAIPCFSEFNGIKYDTSQNATRHCLALGSWENYSDYSSCHDLKMSPEDIQSPGVENTTLIYVVGYGVSLLALTIAVWIFLYFKDLRCLRNTIHTNLMFTYIMADFTWILNYALQMSVASDMSACLLLTMVLHYFHLTNFFWMFVEGLYLYMLVVETFTRENIKLRVYLAIGWGTPALIVPGWALARGLSAPDPDSQGLTECPWMDNHSLDWIYQGPVVTVLILNLVFLNRIMWVLITKLRSTNNQETQQYRKAAKALLILIPLLGVTYILFLWGPGQGSDYAHLYSYVRAFLLSLQGLMVALFYCFLNTEVRGTVKHHLERWREARDLGRRYTLTKDWSPNTRTESIRLYSKQELTPHHYKKRESTVSETTTLTMVGGGSARVSNGSTTTTLRNPTSPYLEAPML